MKVLILNPDGSASTEEAPDEERARWKWLKEQVGGEFEHVTYLKMIMDDDTLNAVRGSMYVNEIGGIMNPPLSFNYLGTLLYLEASRQDQRIASNEYSAIIRGVVVVMPEAER